MMLHTAGQMIDYASCYLESIIKFHPENLTKTLVNLQLQITYILSHLLMDNRMCIAPKLRPHGTVEIITIIIINVFITTTATWN